MSDSPVWLVTGASSGIGRALAGALAARGHRVLAGTRSPERIARTETLVPFALDAASGDETLLAKVSEARDVFGRLDGLVNNAGYGLVAALEETTPEQTARCLRVNLLTPLTLMRGVLPIFREQKGGTIVNVSAIAAFVNEAGFAVYGGAKAALDAATDAVAKEAAPFGVRVLTVAPGPVRTDFIAGPLERAETPIPGYERTVRAFDAYLGRMDGKQPGDPDALARLVLDTLDAPSLPARLTVGPYALDAARKRLVRLDDEMDAYEDASRATDHPR